MAKGLSLADPAIWREFLAQIRDRLEPGVSWEEVEARLQLIDRGLGWNEAMERAKRLLGDALRPPWIEGAANKGERAKRLVFTKELLSRVKRGEVDCTYRPYRLSGLYYLTVSRFGKAAPQALVEVYASELIDPSSLTDRDARLAGLKSKEELLELLERWYGDLKGRRLYRNWMKLLG